MSAYPLPNIDLYAAESCNPIILPYVLQGLSCGFPSPAEDYIEQSLDLNKLLIKDKESTFFGRVKGNSMIDANILDGDVVVIDRSLDAKNNSIALCMLDGEFTVKRIIKRSGRIILHPANPQYRPIPITPEMNFHVWGVVTYIIHKA